MLKRLPVWLLSALLLLAFAIGAQAQTVSTDKADYAPGETVQITGSGFHPNETVSLEVDATDGLGWDYGQPWTALADAQGNLTSNWGVINAALGRSFVLTADCEHTGPDPAHLSASSMFTDDASLGVTVSPASLTIQRGSSAQSGITAQSKKSTFSGNVTLSATLSNGNPLPTGISVTYSVNPVNVPANGSATSIATINVASNAALGAITIKISGTGSSGANDAANISVTVVAGNTAPVLAAIGSKSVPYQGTLSFTASASDSDTPAQTLSYSLSSAPVGAAINPTSGAFSWVANVAPGNYSATVVVTDNGTPPMSASETISITVAKANQTISFGALGGKTYGDADFTVSATASSGLPVTFTASGNATVTGNTVHITGAGSATITAHQGGDGNYNAASDVPQSFTIAKANQTITFGALPAKTYGGGTFNLTATASSGLTVSYTSADATIASIVDNIVTIKKAGSVVISANQAGDTLYNAAAQVQQTLQIDKKDLFAKADNKSRLYNQPNPAFTGTMTGLVAGDGIIDTYTTAATQMSDVGTYDIVPQLSDPNQKLGNYNVNKTNGTLTINKATATVALSNLSQPYDGSAKSVTATTDPAGLTSVDIIYSQNGTTVTSPTNAGDYDVTATLNNKNYEGSTSGTLHIAKATPTINFTQGDVDYKAGMFDLHATSSSGQQVLFAKIDGPGNVTVASNGTVTIASDGDIDGTLKIKAYVEETANYSAAESPVTFTLKERVAPTIVATKDPANGNGWNKADVSVLLTASDAGSPTNLTISYVVSGAQSMQGAESGTTKSLLISSEGITVIKFTATDANGNVSAEGTVTVKLDKTAPKLTAVPQRGPDHNGWYNHLVTIDFTADDKKTGVTDVSGVSVVPASVDISGSADIAKSIMVTVTDDAGNSCTKTFTYQYDQDAPTVTPGGVSSGDYRHDVSITGLSMTDSYKDDNSLAAWLSAPHAKGGFYSYSPGSSDFTQIPAFPINLPSLGLPEGNYTLHVEGYDQAGNSDKHDVQFTVDQTQPIIALVNDFQNGDAFNQNPFNLDYTLVDNLDPSPFFTLQELLGSVFGYDNEVFVHDTGSAKLSGGINATDEGLYTLTIKARDHATDSNGNEATLSRTFTLDRGKPTTKAEVTEGTKGTNGWYTTPVKITLSATDPAVRAASGSLSEIAGSGVNLLYYVATGAKQIAPVYDTQHTSAVLCIDKQGYTTVGFQSKDRAGNIEGTGDPMNPDPLSFPVKIDTEMPAFIQSSIQDITVQATSRSGAMVNYCPKATDNLSVVTVTSTPTSPHLFAIGDVHTVNVSAKDDAGNEQTTTFNVKVTKMDQIITFVAPATAKYGDGTINLVATTTGLPDATHPMDVTLKVISGNGTLSGNVLTITGAGPIVIEASQPGDEHYNAATSVQQTIDVAKKELTVTAENISRKYGVDNPTFTVTYDGFVNGDDKEDLGGTLTFDTVATTSTGVGDYDVTPSGLTSANYEFHYVAGKLTIEKADLTVNVDPKTRKYGQVNPTFTAHAVGLVNGDTLDSIGVKTFSTTADQHSAVGNYPINTTASEILQVSNYNVTHNDGTLTITKATVASITVNGGGPYTYDGQTHKATGTVIGVLGEILADPPMTFTYNGSPSEPKDANSYAVIGVFAGDNNYEAAQANGTLVINRAKPTVTVNGGNYTYDGQPHPATGTAKGVQGEDLGALSFSYSPGGVNAPVGQGSYMATGSFAGNQNYCPGSNTAAINIAKATITVSVSNVTRILNDPSALVIPISVNGVVAGDGITFTPSATLPNPQDVGVFPISVATNDPNGKMGNYTVVYTNPSPTVTITYKSTNSGVLQPLNQDGSSVNKQGSTIPVKFQVFDANGNSVGPGPNGQCIVSSFTLVQTITGTAVDVINEDIISTTPDTTFRWDATAQQWIFNLSTKNLSAKKTYIYRIALRDGSVVGPASWWVPTQAIPSVSFRFGLK